MSRFLRIFALLMILFGLGNASAADYGIEPTALSISPVTVTMYPGWQIELQLLVIPFNADTGNIIWESTDEAVAIVQNGRIEAISPGDASIIARVQNTDVWATCQVQVLWAQTPAPSSSPSPTPTKTPAPNTSQAPSPSGSSQNSQNSQNSQTSQAPQTPQISVLLAETGADLPLLLGTGRIIDLSELSGHAAITESVVWASSDARVATVDQGGFVSAMGVGRCVVTATFGRTVLSCTVAVINPANPYAPAPTQPLIPVVSFSLPRSIVIFDEASLSALIRTVPSNATDKRWKWTTTNPRIVTISQSGVAKAHSPGSATITLTHASGGDAAVITVTVP